MKESIQVINSLFEHGIIQLLGGLVGLVVLAFIVLIGVLCYLALTQMPKLTGYIQKISVDVGEAVHRLGDLGKLDDKVDHVSLELALVKKNTEEILSRLSK